MSKKNIARTAIEGGRTGYSKHERRESSQHERTMVRTLIAGAHGDPEAFEDVMLPKRKKAYKDFADKLNPIERWLDSRLGKSWNKTYSLLKEKFDSRTTAGRHIVYDHMLSTIWTSPDRSDKHAHYHRYYVDARGLLRKMPSWKKQNEEVYKLLREEKVRVEQWLDHRLIGRIGNVLYWYNPTVKHQADKFDWFDGKYTYTCGSLGWNYPSEVRFIRGDRLSGRDIEFFTKLSPHHKQILLKHSKVLTSCQCIHAVHHHVGDSCRIPGCNCEVKWL